MTFRKVCGFYMELDMFTSALPTREIWLWLSCLNALDNSERPNRDPLDNIPGGMEASVGRSKWCSCANCIPMPTAKKSDCCKITQLLTVFIDNVILCAFYCNQY